MFLRCIYDVTSQAIVERLDDVNIKIATSGIHMRRMTDRRLVSTNYPPPGLNHGRRMCFKDCDHAEKGVSRLQTKEQPNVFVMMNKNGIFQYQKG